MQVAIIVFLALIVLVDARKFAQAIEEGLDAFRGGPRPPSHALPSNDAWFLTRRRSRMPKWRL